MEPPLPRPDPRPARWYATDGTSVDGWQCPCGFIFATEVAARQHPCG